MRAKQMRVMFVTNSLSGGGAERATNILVNALHDSGIKVSLVPINDGVRDLVEPKCEIFELKRQWQGGIFTLFSAFFSLQRTITSWKPTIIVLNCDLPELLGSLSIGSHKLVAVEHATFPWKKRVQLGKIVRMLLEFRHVRWVSVSDHLLIWQSKQIACVIKNAVVSQSEVIKNKSILVKRLNFVGRLSVEKQPSWIVEIAKKTNLPTRIIGDGILMEDLQESSKELNNLVEFLGHVSDPWEYFEDSDLLIVPSLFEGDGLVVVEALMRGIPILLSDIPDLRRFKLPEINYCKSVDDFSRTVLNNLLSLDNLKVSGDIVKNITSNRDPRFVAEQWTRLLKELRPTA
jgi:glycosyltransferase involved in cell wall biosynthesis